MRTYFPRWEGGCNEGNRGILYFSVTKLQNISTGVTSQLRFIHSLTGVKSQTNSRQL